MGSPGQASPQLFEPCHMPRRARTVSAMRNADIRRARWCGLSIGRDEIILDLLASMLGGAILGILRADDVMNTRLVVMTILLGGGALAFHRDLQRALIWIAFVWFALGGCVLGYGGNHL